MKLKTINYFVACVIVSVSISAEGRAQDQTKFILKLNDSLIGTMKSLGSLNSVIPEDARGKVSTIQVLFDTVDTAVPAVDANFPLTVSGEACMVALTDDLIEKAKSTPLRFSVPTGSTFMKVFLNYRRPNVNNNGSVSKAVEPPMPVNDNLAVSVPAAEHFVILTEQQMMEGQIDITDKIKFDTRFGDVEIGIDQIKGIRFHVDDNNSAIIVLNNGDTVTGIPELDVLKLKTEWGRAEFDPNFVESLVTSRIARFQPNPSNSGPRWMLIE